MLSVGFAVCLSDDLTTPRLYRTMELFCSKTPERLRVGNYTDRKYLHIQPYCNCDQSEESLKLLFFLVI